MLSMNRAVITIITPLFWIKGTSNYSFLLQHYKFDHVISIKLIPLLLSAGISPDESKDVHQTPSDLLGNISDKVKLTCKHSVNNYDTIMWYHRSGGDTSLKLVGYTSYTTLQIVEDIYQGHFRVSGNGEREAFLHFSKLRHPKDSGHYFCAVCSPTMIEKPQSPLQKPLSYPAHL